MISAMRLKHQYNFKLHIMREANTFDLSLLILLAVIWGSAFFNIKIATYSYDPFTLALVRVVFASIPLLILCKFDSSENSKPISPSFEESAIFSIL